MTRQLVPREIGLDPLGAPVRERIELDAAVDALDQRQLIPPAALVALAAVDPGGEALERARQRLDLAQRAAAVGIALPEIARGIGGS